MRVGWLACWRAGWLAGWRNKLIWCLPRHWEATVWKCAVSPTGDRLYITNWHKLLTLARDGTLLATYTDPALVRPRGLHVTPAGQVLVCGYLSHTVLQVGWEGESKLANLATWEDGVCVHWLLSQDKVAEDVVDKDDLNTQKVLDQIQEAVPSISHQSQLRWTRTRQKLSNILRTVRNPAVFYSPSVFFQSVIELSLSPGQPFPSTDP
ncbi:hypothetical protein DPMN_134629 [Dreissena polymorpha]|uniref:Uncharacterized protein n=1 Tax=Dreissena polymorpha TaxID=45954 RepID=A0A9D4G0G0_DREPO|nr:hypothetical protein DPMN_134629 [Dreissena polymorpha]